MNIFTKILILVFLTTFFLPAKLQAQCESGGHSTHVEDNWESCTMSTNDAGRTGHWIKYDFGTTYNLLTSHFWNYNVTDEVGKGFKDVQIDYSLDGNSWTSFGSFTFGIATGENNYEGEAGPDFSGIQARFLIITAINNHAGDACSGLGELKINVKNCGQLSAGESIQNVTCEEGGAIQLEPNGGIAPFTIQWADAGSESYRSNLSAGNYEVSITDNRGCLMTKNIVIPQPNISTIVSTISDLPIPTDTFMHTGIIESAGFVTSSRTVGFRATNHILLKTGFQVNKGGIFSAAIITCVPSNIIQESEPLVAKSKAQTTPLLAVKQITKKILLKVQPNPFQTQTTIQLTLEEAQNVNIGIFSLWGSEVQILANDKNLSAGTHQFTFERNHLSSGMYLVKAFNQEVSLTEKIVLVEN